jgi:hypothetical protein
MEEESSAHAYRLQKINEIQKYIEKERDKRVALCRRYQRGVNIVDGIDAALALTGLFGASGIAVFYTVIAAPIAASLGSIALVTAPLIYIGARAAKKLSLKREKHEKIKTLAEEKLSMISDLISKALNDGYISDGEFSLIISELEKFNNKKEEITKKAM